MYGTKISIFPKDYRQMTYMYGSKIYMYGPLSAPKLYVYNFFICMAVNAYIWTKSSMYVKNYIFIYLFGENVQIYMAPWERIGGGGGIGKRAARPLPLWLAWLAWLAWLGLVWPNWPGWLGWPARLAGLAGLVVWPGFASRPRTRCGWFGA